MTGHCAEARAPTYTACTVLKTRPRRIAFGFLTAILAVGVVVWWLSAAAPRWYQPPDLHDPAANELAELVEQRLVEEVHKIREDAQPWQVRIRDEQVNVWFATRLQKWLEHEGGLEWPARLGTPQVRFEPDQISVAVPASVDGANSADRTITLTFAPQLYEDELRFVLVSVRIGRFGAPGDPIKHLRRLLNLHKLTGDGSAESERDREQLVTWLLQLASGEAALEPSMKLVDDRRVTLTAFRLNRGIMDLTMRTNPPPRVEAE